MRPPPPGSGQGRTWRVHLHSVLFCGLECNHFSKHWDSILFRVSFFFLLFIFQLGFPAISVPLQAVTYNDKQWDRYPAATPPGNPKLQEKLSSAGWPGGQGRKEEIKRGGREDRKKAGGGTRQKILGEKVLPFLGRTPGWVGSGWGPTNGPSCLWSC